SLMPRTCPGLRVREAPQAPPGRSKQSQPAPSSRSPTFVRLVVTESPRQRERATTTREDTAPPGVPPLSLQPLSGSRYFLAGPTPAPVRAGSVSDGQVRARAPARE